MTNTFLDRLGGVLKQELSGFLDFPEIENVPEGIEAIKALIGQMAVEKHHAHKKLSALSVAIAELNDKSAKAVALDRDDLARAGLRQKQEFQKEKLDLEEKVEFLSHDIEKMEYFLNALSNDGASIAAKSQTRPVQELLDELDELISRSDNSSL